MKPTLALGIDAGGTYTDVALVDLDSGRVVGWAKDLTTKPDPSAGIRQALGQIDPSFMATVKLVSLATTFATNAMVEDTGAEAGLILIGYEEVPATIPRQTSILMLGGGHTVAGEEKAPLDEKGLAQNLPSFLQGLDGVAITGFFSVRNPDHEWRVARTILQGYDIPVVMGHRLSMRLNANKRATTAWWNARLIPLIQRLIKSAAKIIAEQGIKAPLMIVRGDGTLMSAAMAQNRPVDTLLSGPAASILGARHLSGQENALVVDIGGTTTDMAMLKKGAVALDPLGATVGRWKTHVEAAKVRTFGLGGDSLISFDENGKLRIGPRRVVPLAVLAQTEPGVVLDLEAILRRAPSRNGKANPCLFYAKCGPGSLGGQDAGLPLNLDTGPLSEQSLLEDAKMLPYLWRLKRAEEKGQVICAGLTPTDVWVATGRFKFGRRRVAELGLKILARRLGKEPATAAEAVEEEIRRRLCLEAVSFVGNGQGRALAEVAELWFPQDRDQTALAVRVTLPVPVVGSGAPAACCLPQAFKRLNTECILPKTHAVTGAVGAVVGMVSLTVTAIIKVREGKNYSLHSPIGRETFSTLKQAEEQGRRILEELALKHMTENHVASPILDFALEEKKALAGLGQEIHFESILRVRATGRPAVG